MIDIAGIKTFPGALRESNNSAPEVHVWIARPTRRRKSGRGITGAEKLTQTGGLAVRKTDVRDSAVPFVVDGATIVTVSVNDLLPRPHAVTPSLLPPRFPVRARELQSRACGTFAPSQSRSSETHRRFSSSVGSCISRSDRRKTAPARPR